MNIAAELKLHAGEELQHAMILADQIDYLGGDPTATPRELNCSLEREIARRPGCPILDMFFMSRVGRLEPHPLTR